MFGTSTTGDDSRVEITANPDGGATVRLSHLELVGFYNLLNAWLQEATALSDGSPIPPDWTYRQRVQLHQLAKAIGRSDVPHPGDLEA